MIVLQNGRVLKFSKRTDCWCMFSWSTLLGVSIAAVFKVMATKIMGGSHQLRGIVVKNQN
jgi:hypothetical protein